MLASRAGLVPVSTRPWWREVRDILRTEIRGHGGSTAGPPPEINSRTRRSNVVEDEVKTPGHILLNACRNADATRFDQTIQPSRNVHPVTENVIVLHNDVALVNADTELDAIVARCSISLTHLALPFCRATQCINYTGEFDQEAVTGRFDNATPVFSNFRIDNLRPDRPQPVEGAFLVSPDQPRIPRYIGGENCSEAASLAHSPSPAARRRPDRNSLRCSGFRYWEALCTTIGVIIRKR